MKCDCILDCPEQADPGCLGMCRWCYDEYTGTSDRRHDGCCPAGAASPLPEKEDTVTPKPYMHPEVRKVLEDLIDDDPCWFDHHGYCQAHGWLMSVAEGGPDDECPHARAKRILEEPKLNTHTDPEDNVSSAAPGEPVQVTAVESESHSWTRPYKPGEEQYAPDVVVGGYIKKAVSSLHGDERDLTWDGLDRRYTCANCDRPRAEHRGLDDWWCPTITGSHWLGAR